MVPRARLPYRGTTFEEMDLDAVLAREPQVALVDELAHTNVPGSRHAKRWQDVEELLDAGIDVISTVNIQHLESLNDVVERITGVPQRETVPDAVVRAADQIELVDMSPEALRRRMAHGNIYAADKIDAALGNYFRAGNLTALRELALLWLADQVDEGLQRYRAEHHIADTWEARERVVVALTGGPEGDTLIRRAARIAARASGGDLLAVHVARSDGLTGAEPAALAAQRQLVESLGGSYHQVVGDDIPHALLDFARAENATQLVLGATRRSWLSALLPAPASARGRSAAPATSTCTWSPTRTWAAAGGCPGRGRADAAPPARRVRARRGARPAADARPGQRQRRAEPDQRRAGVPGRGDRGRPGRRVRARAAAGRRARCCSTTTSSRRSTSSPSPRRTTPWRWSCSSWWPCWSARSWTWRRGAPGRRPAPGAESALLATMAGSVLRGEHAVEALLDRVREAFGMDSVTLLERDGEPSTGRRHGVDRGGALGTGRGHHAGRRRTWRCRPARACASPCAAARSPRPTTGCSARSPPRRPWRWSSSGWPPRPRRPGPSPRPTGCAPRCSPRSSHDLRTPLASAKAAVTSLRSPDDHLDARPTARSCWPPRTSRWTSSPGWSTTCWT